MERCDGWMDGWLLMAGALWWSPAVWSGNEGLGLAADCATPINLARSAGFFWGAGAGKLSRASNRGECRVQCVTVLSTVFCQVCLSSSTKPGRWCEVVQSAAGYCSVLR
jgi:hypothetical protein